MAAVWELTLQCLAMQGNGPGEPGLQRSSISVAPLRIDVLTAIDAVVFDEAWAERVTTRFLAQTVGVLSLADLIRNKRAAARAQDLADLEWLERSAAK